MTPTEHMVAWIESSAEHYKRLLVLETVRKDRSQYQHDKASIAARAFGIVQDAYREATRGGDMFASDWTAADLLDAAKALLSWELEQ